MAPHALVNAFLGKATTGSRKNLLCLSGGDLFPAPAGDGNLRDGLEGNLLHWWKQTFLKSVSRAINSLLISLRILQNSSGFFIPNFPCAAVWLWAIPSQGPLQQIRILLMKGTKCGQADPEGMFRNSNSTGRKTTAPAWSLQPSPEAADAFPLPRSRNRKGTRQDFI